MLAFRFCVAAALCLTLAGPLAADRPMTPEDVARLRQATDVEISPDGETVAYLLSVPRAPFEEEDGPARKELHVVRPEEESRPYVSGEVNVDALTWWPDGKALAFTAKRGDDEYAALYRIPIDGGEARQILGHETKIEAFAVSPGADRIVLVAKRKAPEKRDELKENGFDAEVFEEVLEPSRLWLSQRGEDGEYGEPELLDVEGHASSVDWCLGGDALLVALAPTPLVDDSYTSKRLHVVDSGTGAIRTTIETPGKIGDSAWSPDCSRVALVAAADAHDTAAGRLMVADAASGEFRDLWPGYEGHVRDVAWADRETLLVLGDEGVESVLYSAGLDGTSEILLGAGDAVWNDLEVAGGVVAMLGQTARHPREAFVLPGEAAEPQRLTDSNPWLGEIAFGAQETFTWTARDGLELEGILIRPLDEQPDERYPLILSVHGGPESHDRDGWLTSYNDPGHVGAGRGYAVLYPNYRGSTGRGVEFARSSQGRPAAEEFDDLVDAVDALVEAGIADADRVGITGGSYGGYATAWASTRYSDRFAAGVMFVGISDKLSKLGTTDIPEEMHLVHERKRIWEDWQHFLEASPIYYVEQAKTPLLIMGGTADTRVHPGQSLELFRYLDIMGQTPVRLVRYPGEPHGNRRAASRYDYHLRMLRWFDHYLQGPGGDKPPAEIDYPLQEESNDGDGSDEVTE